MKGKIDKRGWLHIQRAGEMKEQLCPYAVYEEACCGDWCPQFGEPIEGKRPTRKSADDNNTVYVPTGMTFLEICQSRNLAFDDFADEREAQP